VVDANGKLAGLLGGNLVKERYRAKTVVDVMTPRDQLRTIDEKRLGKDPIKAADRFFNENIGIHKMLVVAADGSLRGLVTSTDVEHIVGEARSSRKPARDDSFRLLAGVAIAPLRHPDGSLDRERILTHIAELVEEHVDVVAVSTAHGHTKGVGEMVRMIRDAHKDLTIIAGNVTSGAGVEFLADCGANSIKIGQGARPILPART
jgi:IMP dehydrogenase